MPGKWQVMPLVLALAFLAAACDETPMQSDPMNVAEVNLGVDENAWYEFGGTWFDACNGEIYDLWAKFHIVTHTRTDTNGGLHVTVHENAKYTATGQTTGAEYLGTEMQTYHYNAPSSGTVTYSERFWDRGVTKGPAPNTLALYFVGHFTLNANGEMTASWELDEIRCDGADG